MSLSHLLTGAPQGEDGGNLPLLVGLRATAKRGRLSLRSADHAAPPRIDYHYLGEVDDRRRLRRGLREAPALVEEMGRRLAGVDLPDLDDEQLDRWMLSHLGADPCAARPRWAPGSTARGRCTTLPV